MRGGAQGWWQGGTGEGGAWVNGGGVVRRKKEGVAGGKRGTYGEAVSGRWQDQEEG